MCYERGSHILAFSLSWRVVGRVRTEGFVGLTGLGRAALLGWGPLRVTVCAWCVSVWVGPV